VSRRPKKSNPHLAGMPVAIGENYSLEDFEAWTPTRHLSSVPGAKPEEVAQELSPCDILTFSPRGSQKTADSRLEALLDFEAVLHRTPRQFVQVRERYMSLPGAPQSVSELQSRIKLQADAYEFDLLLSQYPERLEMMIQRQIRDLRSYREWLTRDALYQHHYAQLPREPVRWSAAERKQAFDSRFNRR